MPATLTTPKTASARPINFSAKLIPLILAGQKTQTRRLLSPQPTETSKGVWTFPYRAGPGFRVVRHLNALADWPERAPCSYGIADQVLWVRENHRILAVNGDAILGPQVTCQYTDGSTRNVYLTPAEWAKVQARNRGATAKLPARFMLRSLSRLTLRIDDVRVEQLQTISEDDAVAEGFRSTRERVGNGINWSSARGKFAETWDTLNGDRAAWAVNPWVWVLTFSMLPAGEAVTRG